MENFQILNEIIIKIGNLSTIFSDKYPLCVYYISIYCVYITYSLYTPLNG